MTLYPTALFVSVLLYGVIRAIQYALSPKRPAVAPGGYPVLGHALLFLWYPSALASALLSMPKEPILRFKMPITDMWLVRGPSNIWAVLSNTRTFDSIAVNSFFLKNVLELPGKVISMTRRDNSGIHSKPLPGSNIPADQRFLHMKHKATNDVIGRSGLPTLISKFEHNLVRWVTSCAVGNEWVEYPNLYVFLRDMLFETSVDAFFGPHLLKQSPHLKQEFWQFDEDMSSLTKGIPQVFKPKLRVARDKCIAAVKQWRASAKQNQADVRSSADWDENWGLKCMRLRNEVFQRFEEWDDHTCAASDTAILWAVNTNTIPAVFWFFFETISSDELFSQAEKDIANSAMSADPPRFDLKRLCGSPLLESIYTETLRMYVAIINIRETKHKHELAGYKIPKGQTLVICSYTEHMDERHWNTGEDSEPQPVNKFWGKRFLVNTPDGPVFSMDGCQGKWLPFGLGERMCPGRHFAKHQMMLTLATLTSAFQFEIQTPQGWKPKVDMQHFGLGTLPPKCAVPFRIRRRS